MGTAKLTIELANGTSSEARARDMLIEVLEAWPLDKWRYAERIRIEDGVIPHSHPILTMDSHVNRANPLRMVSTYVHEQLHWFWLLERHEDQSLMARRAFTQRFPSLPIERPRGCGSEFSTYLHVAINYLEFLALGELVGAERARGFLGQKPYYTDIYALVLTEADTIHAILEQHDLIPPSLPPDPKVFIDPR